MGELLIDLQTEIGRDGIDVLHHLGHLILVSHPLFLLQKEIKLHRKALWRGFHLADHQRHIGIYQRMARQPASQILTKKRHIHHTRLYLVGLEILLGNQLFAQLLVNDADATEIVVHHTVHPSAFTLLHTVPVLE